MNLTLRTGDVVLKGYPEYNPSQARGPDGQWTGGGGSSSTGTGAGALTLSTEDAVAAQIRARLPNSVVSVRKFAAGGWEVNAGDGSANSVAFFIPGEPNLPLTFEQVNSADDEGGRTWARNSLQLVLDAARSSNASAIRLEAAGAGAYVWPRVGFGLDPSFLGWVDDPAAYFLASDNGELKERIKRARAMMGWGEAREFDKLVKEGGLEMPVRLAALDKVLSMDDFNTISGKNRYIRDVKIGTPTLGKALLIGVKGFYALPKAHFSRLESYINRVRKSRTFYTVLKGYPEYNPSQARGPDGKWTSGGSDSSTGAVSLASVATDLYERNVAQQGVVSAEEFVASLPADQRAFLRRSQRKLERAGPPTDSTPEEGGYRYRNPDGSPGKWTTGRQRLHESIIRKFIGEAIEKGAFVDDGKPMVVLMGGRGGAGKTSAIEKFLGVNPEKHPDFLYLNSDDIKGMLPGYKGYNAALLHEESSYISDQIERIAREVGLNIIYDATLKSEGSAAKRVEEYKDAGYRVEAFFVHTTPWTSALRAMARAMRSGRYVRPEYILGSTTNERTFDRIKGRADSWMLFDNNGRAPRRVRSYGRSWLRSYGSRRRH